MKCKVRDYWWQRERERQGRIRPSNEFIAPVTKFKIVFFSKIDILLLKINILNILLFFKITWTCYSDSNCLIFFMYEFQWSKKFLHSTEINGWNGNNRFLSFQRNSCRFISIASPPLPNQVISIIWWRDFRFEEKC